MIHSPDTQAKITLWRHKAAEGTLSPEEMREAVMILREQRVTAAVSSEKARAKRTAVKAEVSADDLLAELGDLGGEE